jgi:hypothetical protein
VIEMGLWANIDSHARLITNYNMEKEFLEIVGNKELLMHRQLISAHVKYDNYYEKLAERNLNWMIDKKTMKNKFKIKKG